MSQTSKSSRSGPSPLTIASDPCASSAVRDQAPQVRQRAADDETPTLAPRPRISRSHFDAAPCPSLETTDAPSVTSPVMRRPVGGYD
jgi:hypothetical protein